MSHRRRNHHFRSERGQTAVEFALIAPMLIALLLGIVQAGIAFHHYIAITDAARAAARQAIVARLGGATTAQVTQAAVDAAPDLDPSQLGVAFNPPDPSTAPAGSDVTVTVTYPYKVDILGIVFSCCTLQSKITDRVE